MSETVKPAPEKAPEPKPDLKAFVLRAFSKATKKESPSVERRRKLFKPFPKPAEKGKP